MLPLADAGLELKRRRGRLAFDQPCACLHGTLCSVYEARPDRCRNFECHSLKQARSGQIGMDAALRRIRDARRTVDRVQVLLHACGAQDEDQPLSKRYQNAMSRPIDLSVGHDDAERRGELMLAVNDLMNCLHRDFLKSP